MIVLRINKVTLHITVEVWNIAFVLLSLYVVVEIHGYLSPVASYVICRVLVRGNA